MSFLSGSISRNWDNNVATGKSNWLSRTIHGFIDKNKDGQSTWGEGGRKAFGTLANPALAVYGLAKSGFDNYNKNGQAKAPSNAWNSYDNVPQSAQQQTASWYNGLPQGQQPNYDAGNAYGNNWYSGIGANPDMNYTGGSATFNERTGNYATPPQGNNFLSGYNPTANQYRGIQQNQQRQDNIAGYLNSANGANPFARMNPGDMALSNHNNHTQYMDSQRFMGDMNPSNAQAEFNDQNKARYEAALMSK